MEIKERKTQDNLLGDHDFKEGMRTFLELLEKERWDRHLTVLDFSALLGFTDSSYWNWVAGKSETTIGHFFHALRILGYEIKITKTKKK